jgi:hypothetical protein
MVFVPHGIGIGTKPDICLLGPHSDNPVYQDLARNTAVYRLALREPYANQTLANLLFCIIGVRIDLLRSAFR